MTMLNDGVKDKGKEEEFKVKDIAEIVAQCLYPDLRTLGSIMPYIKGF